MYKIILVDPKNIVVAEFPVKIPNLDSINPERLCKEITNFIEQEVESGYESDTDKYSDSVEHDKRKRTRRKPV